MWGAVGDIVHELEALPERPTYEDEDAEMKAKQDEWADWDSRSDKAKEDGERVVKIASGQGFVVALKGNGEVWYRQVEENVHFNWEYVSSSHCCLAPYGFVSLPFSSHTSLHPRSPTSPPNSPRLPPTPLSRPRASTMPVCPTTPSRAPAPNSAPTPSRAYKDKASFRSRLVTITMRR